MRYIVGIDEVGRGSLAGPVTVVAACINSNTRIVNRALGKLRDSKKLTAKQREAWFKYFQNHPELDYVLARVYPRAIERMNISRAANKAALTAYTRLIAASKKRIRKHKIYLDGGLFLGNGEQPQNAKTVIKGDEKIKVIAVASIIAKVSRDRAITRLAKNYPQYGLEIHKGYGTKKHLRAIKKYGPSEAHRLTFLNKYNKI